MHLITLDQWTRQDVLETIALGRKIKANPDDYREAMKHKTLLMLFEKPSLRTRVSFEVGMTQMGGHAIYYNISTSPLGKKESIEDFAKVVSRMCELMMARLFERADMDTLGREATIPVINGLDNFAHPCQALADLMTVEEHRGDLAGQTLAYLGDSNNNVTHSLIYACTQVGMNIRVGCPAGEATEPQPEVMEKGNAMAAEHGCTITVTHDAAEAAAGADVLYTDSWMSYHIDPSEREERIRTFLPYQVNAELMAHAKPDAIFMNCLPAMRGEEQTAEVIDGPQSVVFDEAENRLHVQKAIMLHVLGLA